MEGCMDSVHQYTVYCGQLITADTHIHSLKHSLTHTRTRTPRTHTSRTYTTIYNALSSPLPWSPYTSDTPFCHRGLSSVCYTRNRPDVGIALWPNTSHLRRYTRDTLHRWPPPWNLETYNKLTMIQSMRTFSRAEQCSKDSQFKRFLATVTITDQ